MHTRSPRAYFPAFEHKYLTAIYQYRREASLMISLQSEDKKKADGNSPLATTSHTPRTYFCSSNHYNYNGTTILINNNIWGAKSGFLHTTYYDMYNLVWRQTKRRRRGDTAAAYYGCLYLPLSTIDYLRRRTIILPLLVGSAVK